MSHTLRSVLRRAWTPLLRQASRSYVVGPDLSDALRACSSLHAQGVSSTVCFWDSGDDSPDDVARAYSAAIQACAQERLDSYVSVKAPALRFSPDSCAALAEQARRHAIGIHFDSLGPEVADRTFELLGELAPGRGSIGCTLPGAWRRSPADAGRAVELDLRVRVVKGQWPDPEAPVTDLRKGFLDVVGQLAGQARHVAVASHDPVVVRAALERLRSACFPWRRIWASGCACTSRTDTPGCRTRYARSEKIPASPSGSSATPVPPPPRACGSFPASSPRCPRTSTPRRSA
jgi:proline dehydrogenase